MNSKPVILHICAAVIFAATLGGCAASSEVGEETPEEPAVAIARPDTSAAASVPVVKPVVSAQTGRQGFTTKEDTIEVEQRSRRAEPAAALTVQPHPGAPSSVAARAGGWTVQIGAFRQEGNAERARSRFERRYRKTAVSKVYDEARTLYRITAGDFSTQKEARRFASLLRTKYPGEYSQAWVVHVP